MHKNNGEEIPSTRVTISHVPLSGSNEDIARAIEALGVTLLSKVRYECARDKNNQLTRFKTGRRYLFTSIPDSPLPRKLEIGIFRAEIYHKEQRLAAKLTHMECYNCLEKGHMAGSCPNPVKCRDCKKEGHKSGDPLCPWIEHAVMHESRLRDREEFPEPSAELSTGLSTGPSPLSSSAGEEVNPAPENQGKPAEDTETTPAEQLVSEAAGESSPRKANPKKDSTKNRLRDFVFKRKADHDQNDEETKDEAPSSKKAQNS